MSERREAIHRDQVRALYSLMLAELEQPARIHPLGQYEAVIRYAERIVHHLDALESFATQSDAPASRSSRL